MNRTSLSAILSVAYKEFLHIYRDRRVLILLIILPPVFTLVFGHAFEAGEMKDVPALLINRDQTEQAERIAPGAHEGRVERVRRHSDAGCKWRDWARASRES